jgi:hypothetical protein
MIPLFVIEHGAALLGQWKLFRNVVAFYVRSLACTLVWGTTFTAWCGAPHSPLTHAPYIGEHHAVKTSARGCTILSHALRLCIAA